MTGVELREAFTPEQERLAKAAVMRYGRKTAERMLAELWPVAPSEVQLRWWRIDDLIVPTVDDVDYWRRIEEQRKAQLQAAFHQQVPGILGAIERLTDPDEFEAKDIPAGKIQSLAIAAGIFYDKLVPGPRMAGAALSIDGVGTLNLMVVAPPAADGRVPRPVALENEP